MVNDKSYPTPQIKTTTSIDWVEWQDFLVDYGDWLESNKTRVCHEAGITQKTLRAYVSAKSTRSAPKPYTRYKILKAVVTLTILDVHMLASKRDKWINHLKPSFR